MQVALYCVCMGFIMYFHEYEPDTMAPFLRGLLTRFLNRTGTPMRSSTSYSYLPSIASSDDRLPPPSASASQNDHNGRGSTLSPRAPSSPLADGASLALKESQKSPEGLTIEAFQGLWAHMNSSYKPLNEELLSYKYHGVALYRYMYPLVYCYCIYSTVCSWGSNSEQMLGPKWFCCIRSSRVNNPPGQCAPNWSVSGEGIGYLVTGNADIWWFVRDFFVWRRTILISYQLRQFSEYEVRMFALQLLRVDVFLHSVAFCRSGLVIQKIVE